MKHVVKVVVDDAYHGLISVGEEGWLDCQGVRLVKIGDEEYELEVKTTRSAPPATSVVPLLVADGVLDKLEGFHELSPCGAGIRVAFEESGFATLELTRGECSPATIRERSGEQTAAEAGETG